MRSLILHCNAFESKITARSTRPLGIVPERGNSVPVRMEECLTVLFCVEQSDTEQQLHQLYEEIVLGAGKLKVHNLMIAPFVHLSNNIAAPEKARELYHTLIQKFEGSEFTVSYSHFGYHKTWLLDIKGHRCAYKYREFY